MLHLFRGKWLITQKPFTDLPRVNIPVFIPVELTENRERCRDKLHRPQCMSSRTDLDAEITCPPVLDVFDTSCAFRVTRGSTDPNPVTCVTSDALPLALLLARNPHSHQISCQTGHFTSEQARTPAEPAKHHHQLHL